MKYKQLKTPDLNVDVIPGWCLAAVKDAFGVQAKYASATLGWQHSIQHQDKNFPENVYIPIWFSIPSVPEGHVAILNTYNGYIYSTSSKTSTKFTVHTSLDAMIKYYGSLNLTYLGWSEDVNDIKVIEEVDMPLTDSQVDRAFKGFRRSDPTEKELQNPDYRDAGLLIDTLWENGGRQAYEAAQIPDQEKIDLKADLDDANETIKSLSDELSVCESKPTTECHTLPQTTSEWLKGLINSIIGKKE